VIDRILNGLRNQGPGAIPALVLSLLALGATAYWLLSQNDDGGAQRQSGEVVSAPAPLAPASSPSEVSPATPTGSGTSSGAGGQHADGGGGNPGGRSQAPVAPPPPGGSSDLAPSDPRTAPADGGGSNGGRQRGLEQLQELLNGNQGHPSQHHGSNEGLPGLENLLGNGSGSSNGDGSPLTAQGLLDQIQK
jgi:hypothetical protein